MAYNEPGWPSPPATKPLGPNDPQEVGGYRLRVVLGHGGMGKVYLADAEDGRPVAIKIVHPEFADDPAFRRRFEQEVDTARRVHGAHTASVIDAGTRAAQPWLATDYVPGPSLQFVIGEHGPLPAARVLALVAEVAGALHSIHAAGVVHRDLKPSNVILASDGPKVIDFGIARAADTTSVTKTGMRPGTPAYMSPEHVRGEEVTPAADVFALGVLANYAATGELAFGGGTDPAVAYRILEQEPNVRLCPEPVRSIVLKCLDKDPRRRPSAAGVSELCRSSTGADATAVVPAAGGTAGDTVWTAPVMNAADAWERPRRSRPTLVLAAAAVVVAVVAGLFVFIGWPSGGERSAADSGDTRSPGSAGPGNPPSTAPSTTVGHDPQARSELAMTFSIDPIPGVRTGDSAVIGPSQTIAVRTPDAQSGSFMAAWVSVYAPGSFDAGDAQDGERVTVGGRSGFYDPAAFADSDVPAKPSLAVSYGTDSWFVVQSDLPPAQARDFVLKVAAKVRFGETRPLRFPLRFSSLPNGVGPCGAWDGLDPARFNPGPWRALVYLCDKEIADWSDPQGSNAISIDMNAEIDRAAIESYTPLDTTIGGRPARVDEASDGIPPSVMVDHGDFIVTIAASDGSRYTAAELRRIAEKITSRDYANKDFWFTGAEALPTN